MKLIDHPLTTSWLLQFRKSDQPFARNLIRSLRLVSFSEMERQVVELLRAIPSKDGRPIALFPVERPEKTHATATVKRPHYSSADRIGHALTGLEREYNKSFRVVPTVTSMRSEKLSDIVLIDDIIGSGRSIEKYCLSELPKTVKSWCSYGKCKIWVIAYAGHQSSCKRLTDKFNYIKPERIKLYLTLPDMPTQWNKELSTLCERYASETSKPRAAFGVGDHMTQIIFQYGCPNNAPAILWANSKKWSALFPDRAIPSALFECFDVNSNSDLYIETLWHAGQCRLALQLIDRMDSGNPYDRDLQLLTILGLISRGMKSNKISAVMLCSKMIIESLLDDAKKFNLIDNNERITQFGINLINMYRHKYKRKTKTVESNEDAVSFYYPRQYKGIQRKSR